MENLKIKINDDKDQIIDLLKQYGCKYFNCTGSNKTYLLLEDGKVFFCKLKSNFNASKCKEITLPELRDMVVLKRNDVGDATHTDPNEKESLYFRLFGEWWNLFTGGRWQQFCHTDSPRAAKLKPIEKKEMKEYLVKSQDGNWREETTLTGDPADTVIEIPTGAEKYIEINKQNFAFYRNNFKEVFLGGWEETACNSENLKLFNSCSVLWQRNQEPKQAEFLVKTDGGYVLQVLDENAGGSDVVRVPDGADTFAGDDNCHYFWQHRSGKKNLLIGCGSSLERYPQWVECEDSADEWLSNFDGDNSLRILWQREISAEEFKSKLPESTFKDFKQPEDLPFLDNGVDIGVENLPEFKPFNNGQVEHDSTAFTNLGIEYPIKNEIKTDFPLNRGDVNYRAAIAFNAIRGTDLTEDDVHFLRELLNSITNHYGA